MPRTFRASFVRFLLPVYLLSLPLISACTKPVTTSIAPPAVATMKEDQEIIGLQLKDGSEQLFYPSGPVFQDGEWVGPTHAGTVRIPAADVEKVIIQEEKTNVLSIVAIGAFIGLGIAAIAIAAPQR
jgi:hypothetical protein